MAKPKATRLTITEFQAAAGKFSQETLRLNPDLAKGTVERAWNARQHASEPKKAPSTAKPSPDGPQPNKTELRFHRWMMHQMGFASIDLVFSPLTLRIGRRRYTPDWVYFGFEYGGDDRITLFEVKGAHIWDDAKLKYDLFKTHFGHRFDFQLWQEVEGMWTKIR